MVRIRCFIVASLLLCALALPAALATASGQTTPSVDAKLAVKAALVLTPEFCATKFGEDHTFFKVEQAFYVGKAACESLEPALNTVFSGLTRVDAASSAGDAQVVLLPRFVDVNATKRLKAHANRELIVLLEWTAKDRSGNTLWIETVQSSETHQQGRSHGQQKRNAQLLTEDAAKDLAAQSAGKMAASPELRKLVQ